MCLLAFISLKFFLDKTVQIRSLRQREQMNRLFIFGCSFCVCGCCSGNNIIRKLPTWIRFPPYPFLLNSFRSYFKNKLSTQKFTVTKFFRAENLILVVMMLQNLMLYSVVFLSRKCVSYFLLTNTCYRFVVWF